MVRAGILALTVTFLVTFPCFAADRLDIYGKDGQRQGWAVVDEQTGRAEIYDKDGRRQGYGRIQDERIEVFDKNGRRQETIAPGRMRVGRRP